MIESQDYVVKLYGFNHAFITKCMTVGGFLNLLFLPFYYVKCERNRTISKALCLKSQKANMVS